MNAEFAFTASPATASGLRVRRMGPGYITGDSGKEEKKSLRSTRWCCEHTVRHPGAPYSGIFALANDSFQEFSAQTPVVQRQISAFGPTLGKNEEKTQESSTG